MITNRTPSRANTLKERTDELEKLQQIVNQFINSCSHSMRGPLKSIEGLVGLLQNNPNSTNENTCVLFNLIMANTNRMEHMLDELEQFLQNHKRKISSNEIALKEVIDEVAENFDDVMKEKKITLLLQVNQQFDFYNDTNRLRMILINLMDNAIRFHHCNEENKWININTKANMENCSITIKDNGVGIPKEYYENINKPFFRGSSKSDGFGMGLYLVRELINKMNGQITISSDHNTGSTIKILIPNNYKKAKK